MNINEIYTEVIMDHSQSGHNRHPVVDKTHSEHGHNPNCGDDLKLEVKIKAGRVEDAGFTGVGCAISQASASMMIDLIKGCSVEEAKEKTSQFLSMIRGDMTAEELEDSLADASLLANIKNMPARVKCAVLAWHTLDQILSDL